MLDIMSFVGSMFYTLFCMYFFSICLKYASDDIRVYMIQLKHQEHSCHAFGQSDSHTTYGQFFEKVYTSFQKLIGPFPL